MKFSKMKTFSKKRMFAEEKLRLFIGYCGMSLTFCTNEATKELHSWENKVSWENMGYISSIQ